MSAVSFSLSEILQWCGGRLANEGALEPPISSIRVSAVSGLAGSAARDLAFFFSRAYQREIPDTHAGILVTGEPFVGPLENSGLPIWKKTAIIACQDPYLAMARLSAKFAEGLSAIAHISVDRGTPPQIHPSAIIDPSARLADGTRVGANVVIEAGVEIGAGTVIYPGCFIGPGCRIGEACVLFPNVVLYERTQVGNRVRLHAGVVLGADGFGYAPRFENGEPVEHVKIYHLGRVVVADDVEIGALSSVDRGTLSDTRVDRGVKIDNNVQIGHNAHIAEGAVLCGMSGVAGSSTLGRFCYLGALAGLGNSVQVGDGTKIGPGTLITKSVGGGKEMMGFPQREFDDFYKIQAMLNRMLKSRKDKKEKKDA